MMLATPLNQTPQALKKGASLLRSSDFSRYQASSYPDVYQSDKSLSQATPPGGLRMAWQIP
jgi:hypothetical protein